MKIANIVYENDLINHKKVDFINYYQESVKYGDLDRSLPTLYVGWNFMKQVNSNDELFEKADILKHRMITNQLYWEFSFEESKQSHISGVESFVKYVPEFYFNRYSYTNLDPVFFQLNTVQDLTDVLPKEIDAVLFASGNMLYILKDNKITGLNMEMYEFFNFDRGEIIYNLQQRCFKHYDDSAGTTLMEWNKQFPNFHNLKRYLIVLLTN